MIKAINGKLELEQKANDPTEYYALEIIPYDYYALEIISPMDELELSITMNH